MKQLLGPRKTRRIERLTQRAVRTAWTRGGWEHFVAFVSFTDGTQADVNYKTGEATFLDKQLQPMPTPPLALDPLSDQTLATPALESPPATVQAPKAD